MSDAIQNTPQHQDAKQDYEEIVSVVEQKLAPVFEVLGQMLHALDEKIEDVDDVVHRMVEGFASSVGEHRKGELGSLLSENFGDALGKLNPLFQDMHGTSYADALIETLMSEEGEPDLDSIADRISGDMDKYGKYIGIAGAEPEGGAEAPEGEAPEGEPEETAGGEEPKLETGMDRLVRVNLGGILGKPPTSSTTSSGAAKPISPTGKERGSDKMKRYEKGTDEARDKEGEFERKHEEVEAKDRAEGKERGMDKLKRRMERGSDKAKSDEKENAPKEPEKKSNVISLGDYTDPMIRSLAEFSQKIAKRHAQ